MIVALLIFFFFNDTATTEIYTLSLHDALPISRLRDRSRHEYRVARRQPHVLVLAHMRQIDADARRAARGDRQAVRGDDHGLRGNPQYTSLDAEGTLLRRAAADPKRPHESDDGHRRRQRLAEFASVHILARSPRHAFSAGRRRHSVAWTTRLLLWTTYDRERLPPTRGPGGRLHGAAFAFLPN